MSCLQFNSIQFNLFHSYNHINIYNIRARAKTTSNRSHLTKGTPDRAFNVCMSIVSSKKYFCEFLFKNFLESHETKRREKRRGKK